MNQLKQVLITTAFISRKPYVINICCAYFQTETSWQFPVISFVTMNELEDNASFWSGFLIVIEFSLPTFMLSLNYRSSQYCSWSPLIDSEQVKNFSSPAAYWVIIRMRSRLPPQNRQLTKRITGSFF